LREPAVDKALQNDRVVRFATFKVDLRAGELRKGGLKLKLNGQPVQDSAGGRAPRQYDRALQEFESLGDDWGVMCAYREKEMYAEALAVLKRWNLNHPAEIRRSLAVTAGILWAARKEA
jgi:hypothetical protein